MTVCVLGGGEFSYEICQCLRFYSSPRTVFYIKLAKFNGPLNHPSCCLGFVHCFFDWLVGHNYDGISLEVRTKFSRSHYQGEGDLLWWAQISHLCRPQSWAGTNNTSRLVIPAMVVALGRARSLSSIREPLQNINSLLCRWKDNSPLAHHRGVTKREWISPSKPQRIERGACAYTGIYKYEPQAEGVRITQQIL